jgi:flavin-dependent dehydrogenase
MSIADVLVVGAGPAGIATAIAASSRGLRVAVVDSRRPPIDKPCGEGLLPDAVAALRSLGVDLNSDAAFPLRGIRFADEESSVSAAPQGGFGFGIRRTTLHRLLVQRAEESGVLFLWDARVSGFDLRHAFINGRPFTYKWLVGADGQSSTVRKWAKLNTRRWQHVRFGFRKHFAVSPWSDLVEVYWGNACQLVATPTSASEVCISLFSRDSQLRTERALALFPNVARQLRGARQSTPEMGTITALRRVRSVVRGRVSLVGDASGSVDGISGQGLSLAFQQALHLAEAMEREDLTQYESAHRRIARMPARMTMLLLTMDRSIRLRRRTLRLFASKPGLFSKMISIHTGALSRETIGAGEIFDLGWQVLRA